MSLHHRRREVDLRSIAKDEQSRLEQEYTSYFADRQMQTSPTASVETYASTIPSEREEIDDTPEYCVPQYTARTLEASALAASPSDFSELFPSRRLLQIRHDDTTVDGNMNLRIDTPIAIQGRKCDMTLFHLRMQDLKYREFSLRRYHRDSGREVCHSVRKKQKPAGEKRPGFQRSISNALQNIRPRPEQRSSTSPTVLSLKRNDSGYSSMHSMDAPDDDTANFLEEFAEPSVISPASIRLEFSNYAQVEVSRTGVKGKKGYEFSYWGVAYEWKRLVRKDNGVKQVAFRLTRAGNDRNLASIDPVELDDLEIEHLRRSGGWVPPCNLQITDDVIIRAGKDVADAIVAAGLIALIDDSIRRHFRSEEPKQQLLPVPRINVGIEYIGPRRLLSGMFGRKTSQHEQQSRPASSGEPTSAAASLTGSRGPGSSRASSYEYR